MSRVAIPKCNTCKYNYKSSDDEPRCNRMCENFDEYKPMTNFERIKNMNVIELGMFLNCHISDDDDFNTVIEDKVMYRVDDVVEWLESEVDES